jgi:hypothetical protein
MKTSCFFSYQGPGRISIARYEPRGVKGYRRYSALAPRAEMLKMSYEEYLPLYLAILARLDPQKVWDDLHALVAPAEPILLCWERPPLTATNWCHREMVCSWLKGTLGFDVEEYDHQRMSVPEI